MRVVFHYTPFYGQMNKSESCPVTETGSCSSDLKYDVMNQFCGDVNKCDIPRISHDELDLKQCKDTSNYLTIHHSCQKGWCSSPKAGVLKVDNLLPFPLGIGFSSEQYVPTVFLTSSRSVDTHRTHWLRKMVNSKPGWEIEWDVK